MNEIFIIGKVTSKVKFDFLINCCKKSKASCEIKLENESIITIIGFDNIADLMYNRLKENDKVFIYGKIYSDKIYIKKVTS